MRKIVKQLLQENLDFLLKKSGHYDSIVDSQSPKVTLVTCSDSRVPPHCLCTDTVNEVFTIENMGNQLKTAEGTLDYGILHLMTPVLVFLGHTNCGAVNASLADYSCESDAIKRELDTLDEGYKETGADYAEDEHKRADKFAEQNVDYQVSQAVARYPKLVESGKLTIIGMMFDFADTYAEKKGLIYVTNVNTKTDKDKIKEILQIDEERIKRLS